MSQMHDKDNKLMEKIKRPKTTTGKCYRIETGCGHLYVTIGNDEKQMIEIFAHLGKAGGCATSQNEGLTRAISLGLKYGVPIKEYIKQLKGIRCPAPVTNDGREILSCADAISKVLQLEIKGKTKDDMAEAKRTS